jgi:hypothetical protein
MLADYDTTQKNICVAANKNGKLWKFNNPTSQRKQLIGQTAGSNNVKHNIIKGLS